MFVLSSIAIAAAALPARDEVARLLTGEMTTAAQAARDREYYPIHFSSCSVTVAGDSSDSVFLYVEQAVEMARERPYRQRIYEIRALASGEVESVIHRLENEGLFVGFCARAERTLPAAAVLPAECSVTLRRVGEFRYLGQTPEGGCASTFQGAVKTTSEVELFSEGVNSWDRGWDAEGRQVWGPAGGAYEFRRVP